MLIAISLLLIFGSILGMYFLETHKQNWLRKNGVEILRNHFKYGVKVSDPPYYGILSHIIVWGMRIGLAGFFVGIGLFLLNQF